MSKVMTKEERNLSIKRLNGRGMTDVEVANRLGISRSTVYNVLNNYPNSKTKPTTTKTKRKKRQTKPTSTTSFNILWGLFNYTHTSFSRK